MSGGQSIPYDQFSYAGINYLPTEKYKDYTLSGLNLKPSVNNQVLVGIKEINNFGKKMGFKEGDILYSDNAMLVNTENVFKLIDKMISNILDRYTNWSGNQKRNVWYKRNHKAVRLFNKN